MHILQFICVYFAFFSYLNFQALIITVVVDVMYNFASLIYRVQENNLD